MRKPNMESDAAFLRWSTPNHAHTRDTSSWRCDPEAGSVKLCEARFKRVAVETEYVIRVDGTDCVA
jgi:hypothetical protein